jgi:hypothetical protein
MRIPRSGSGVLRIFGYIIFIFGALGMAHDIAFRVWRSVALDMGIALGDGAIVLIGLVAPAVANCLRRLEQRLDRLETTRASS